MLYMSTFCVVFLQAIMFLPTKKSSVYCVPKTCPNSKCVNTQYYHQTLAEV